MDWFKLNARALCSRFKCFENNHDDRVEARRKGRHILKAEMRDELTLEREPTTI